MSVRLGWMLCAVALGCTRSAPGGTPPEARDSVNGDDAATVPPAGDGPGAAQDVGDPPEAEAARKELVDQIEFFDRPWGDEKWDPRVITAMRSVRRHLFMPGTSLYAAYRDAPHPIGYDQTISQPTVVALMSNALRLEGTERVLEIGTGSGYQAAVLSSLCRDVFTIEIIAPLGEAARERLARLGYRNVHVRIGDGYRGWPEQAPFDRVILTAAPATMPPALVDQLRPGGIIVAPLGDDFQVLERWTKRADGVSKERLGGVRFVPMVPAEKQN